ncbi:hypothetical protein HK405_008015, partial [Cladochytrium tenue]
MASLGRLSLKFDLDADTDGGAELPAVAIVPPPRTDSQRALAKWVASQASLDKLDRRHIRELVDPARTPTESRMTEAITAWAAERASLFAKKRRQPPAEQPTSTAVSSLRDYPMLEISQPGLLGILTRCLACPSDFWPVNVIRYLLRTGSVPAAFAPVRSIAAAALAKHAGAVGTVELPAQISLVDAIIEKGDLQTLALLLDPPGLVADVDEADLVRILKFVCCCQPTAAAAAAKAPREDQALRELLTRRDAINRVAALKMDRDAGGDGRRWFLQRLFAAPRDDTDMTAAMRAALGPAE